MKELVLREISERNERGKTKHITKAQTFQTVKTVKTRFPSYNQNKPDPNNWRVSRPRSLQVRAKIVPCKKTWVERKIYD